MFFFEEFKLIKFTVCLLVQSIKAEKHFELIIDINKLIKLYFPKIIHSFLKEHVNSSYKQLENVAIQYVRI